ncbi:hypothetical protein COU37_00450 [Candidatus Micrarchaeota archaeon CG10_big_fil_rev_8_21_14_0_10_45_29]|nr:MAG: hypothetical protein COU37_00450 [Candidatus Micrarchaeota archaeon CG10_big_fil_rev_8_21_14_0_10_45_29]
MNEILFLTSNKHKIAEAQTILTRNAGGNHPKSSVPPSFPRLPSDSPLNFRKVPLFLPLFFGKVVFYE